MKSNQDLRLKIGNGIYMILLFLFVADPTNTIFGLKNEVFVLLFFYSLFFLKADWSKIVYFIIPVAVVSISWVFALIQGNRVDMFELKQIYTSLIPLLLLLWSDTYDVIKLSQIPVTLMAFIVLTLFFAIVLHPQFEEAIYMFMWSHDNSIMMSNRYILGIKFFCMYPKSAVAMIPVLGYSVYNSITKNKRNVFNVITAVLLSIMFLISGTRSSVMFSVLLIATILFLYCRNRRYMRYIIYPAAFMFLVVFVVVIIALLMETDEFSNMVKYAHMESYGDLFEANPLYMLFGQGPATDFYTDGFNTFAYKTEWTYIELIRNYGLLSLLIGFVFLTPIFIFSKYIAKDETAIVFIISYIIYFIIAGTNPLLFSSTGMMVVITMFSYSEYIKKVNKPTFVDYCGS